MYAYFESRRAVAFMQNPLRMLGTVPCYALLPRCEFFGAILTVGLGFLAGCGKSGPAVEMVEGVILLDGKPLAGATVGFSPLTAGVGLPASGVSEVDGTFRLTASRGGKPGHGTAVGDYAVTVAKTERISEPPSEDRPASPLRIRHLVPPAYGSVATSGLTATVKKGLNGGDAFRYDLKSNHKPE